MTFTKITFASDEHKQALQLRNEFLRKPLGLPLLDKIPDEEKNWVHYVASENNKVIACVVVIHGDSASVKLRQMVVHEKIQSQGVGKKLLAYTENELQQAGVNSLLVHARLEAVGFYEKAGYKKMGEEFYEVSVPHFAMIKRIIP